MHVNVKTSEALPIGTFDSIMRHSLSVSCITGDVTFNHLDKMVSARFLYYKISYFLFAMKSTLFWDTF